MNHIVVVGGGTSGWMAAIALSAHFPEKQITVIDPTAISPIGVGESVTGVVQAFVSYEPHRLDITEFYRETDATLKLGIWYKNWRGPGDDYVSPIDAPNRFFDHHYSSSIEDFFALATAQGQSLGDLQTHGALMRANKTDYYRRPDGTIAGDLSMASCHFDALRFAAWLKSKCATRPAITHVDDVVRRVEQDPESGLVTRVVTEKGLEIAGDFFLDCTGFRRLLLEKVYSPRWVDLSSYLKVDSAIPQFGDYAEGQDIPVYTTATAMRHGWMWQVPTMSRLGRGYVYSSKYVSDEDAIRELREQGVDPGDDPRIIRFQPGKLDRQWVKNVCAIGLAGGFLEPLEATTIHIIHVQIRTLVELFLPYYTLDASETLARKYNSMMEIMYDDYVDFVGFHYHTGRSDTDFWRDYQKREAITDENQARMDKWKHTYPAREDFPGLLTSRVLLTSGLLVWMPMLCALGMLSQTHAQTWIGRSKFSEKCRRNVDKYLRIREHIRANAVGQRDAIRHLSGRDQVDFGSSIVGAGW